MNNYKEYNQIIKVKYLDMSKFIINFVKKEVMGKTYQPHIIEKAKEIVKEIRGYNVFDEFDIKSDDHAHRLLCDILTDKLISGDYNESDDFIDIFPTVSDFEKYLSNVVTLDSMDNLIENGYIGIMEDENNETFYFATEKGKSYKEKFLKNK